MAKFEIPNSTLSQLNEFSSGGFLLLTFDEDGRPDLNCKFDNPAYASLGREYLSKWLSAIDDIQMRITIDNMMGAQEIEIELDEEDYPDEEDEN
jgi:hypothetical protein